MDNESTLREEPIAAEAVHLCVDMQRIFGTGTPWELPWMARVLPRIEAICALHARQTIFTRFVPARQAGEGRGTWQRYWRKWAELTLEATGPDLVRVVPELEVFIPPADTVDKAVYSPWLGSDLHARLARRRCDTLVITGGESDMCVLGAVLGAVDWGFRVILVRDAICSTSDESHDAMLRLFSTRFGEQVEVATTDEVLTAWAVPQE